MSERQLARVVKIDQVIKHPNADSLDLCKVGGWQVVAKLGEFKAGELAIYFEIDSWIPVELAPFLIKGSEPHEYNGVYGERLRTIKLRKELSQGLLLPLSILNNVPSSYGFAFGVPEGEDLTEVLGIQKWERPLSANLRGMAKGNFPSFLRKTDKERIQNLKFDRYQDLVCEVTEKLDGCVKGTTLLEVKGKGQVPIRQVQVGDYILGYDHDNKTSVWTEVVGVQATKSPQKEWYTLTAGNKTLTLTGNHKIFVVELNKYVAVEDLVNLPNYTNYNLLTF